jgi:hypothetical protein
MLASGWYNHCHSHSEVTQRPILLPARTTLIPLILKGPQLESSLRDRQCWPGWHYNVLPNSNSFQLLYRIQSLFKVASPVQKGQFMHNRYHTTVQVKARDICDSQAMASENRLTEQSLGTALNVKKLSNWRIQMSDENYISCMILLF